MRQERHTNYLTSKREDWETGVNLTTKVIGLIEQPNPDRKVIKSALEEAKISRKKGLKMVEETLTNYWDLDKRTAPPSLRPFVIQCQALKLGGQDLDSVRLKAKALISSRRV